MRDAWEACDVEHNEKTFIRIALQNVLADLLVPTLGNLLGIRKYFDDTIDHVATDL